jgi:hydroxyquinol 1,2-dioxygenase
VTTYAGSSSCSRTCSAAGSPYLDSDAVFGVKESLVRDFAVTDDPALAARCGR